MVAFGWRRARRAVAIAVAGLCCAVPSLATAAGLGAVTQQSGLGQSLRMVVPVTLAEGEDVPAECFRIAFGQGAPTESPISCSDASSSNEARRHRRLVVTTPRTVHGSRGPDHVQAGMRHSVRRDTRCS
jgi:hypothetical protein